MSKRNVKKVKQTESAWNWKSGKREKQTKNRVNSRHLFNPKWNIEFAAYFIADLLEFFLF